MATGKSAAINEEIVVKMAVLALALLFYAPKEHSCPFDGQTGKLFAERDKDGKHQCGYQHDYRQPQTGHHFVHVFWTDCS
jgi:hypothetical protein